MLRRAAALLALFTLLAPALGRANDWEENYADGGQDEAPPDDYRVSVDMGVSGSVDIDSFQDALQPYGDWTVVGNYGRVFRPRVSPGWRPYYYGRWEWTSEGWLWVSDEPFGWAAYHYGRWAYDSYQGWLWVPGYQWAPAWVSWRYSLDVVGWAPLAPGVSVYASATPFQEAFWTFVPCQSFVGYPVRSIAFAPSYSRRYFEGSAPAPARPGPRELPGRLAATPAWGGPPPRAIEQRTGRPINPVRGGRRPAPRGRPGDLGRGGHLPPRAARWKRPRTPRGRDALPSCPAERLPPGPIPGSSSTDD